MDEQDFPKECYNLGIMKKCSKCHESRPLSCFTRAGLNRDGSIRYHAYCKTCRVGVRSDYYAKYREGIILKTSVNGRKYSAPAKQYVLSYLLNHPCIDCGESDVDVLEFDHVRGEKKNSVAMMKNNYNSPSLDTLISEIEKCEVRCANCHRRITAKRRRALSSNG